MNTKHLQFSLPLDQLHRIDHHAARMLGLFVMAKRTDPDRRIGMAVVQLLEKALTPAELADVVAPLVQAIELARSAPAAAPVEVLAGDPAYPEGNAEGRL